MAATPRNLRNGRNKRYGSVMHSLILSCVDECCLGLPRCLSDDLIAPLYILANQPKATTIGFFIATIIYFAISGVWEIIASNLTIPGAFVTIFLLVFVISKKIVRAMVFPGSNKDSIISMRRELGLAWQLGIFKFIHGLRASVKYVHTGSSRKTLRDILGNCLSDDSELASILVRALRASSEQKPLSKSAKNLLYSLENIVMSYQALQMMLLPLCQLPPDEFVDFMTKMSHILNDLSAKRHKTWYDMLDTLQNRDTSKDGEERRNVTLPVIPKSVLQVVLRQNNFPIANCPNCAESPVDYCETCVVRHAILPLLAVCRLTEGSCECLLLPESSCLQSAITCMSCVKRVRLPPNYVDPLSILRSDLVSRFNVKQFWVPVTKRVRLDAMFIPAINPLPDNRTMILCNPNAGYMECVSIQFDWLYFYLERGINVVTFNYRGYSRSQGSPHPSTVGSDGEAVVRYLRRNLNLTKIGVHGISVGGLCATQIAKRCEEIDVLIADRTFASLRAIASHLFGSWAGWTMENLMNWSASVINDYIAFKGPKLAIYDPADEIICEPASLKTGIARRLFQLSHHSVCMSSRRQRHRRPSTPGAGNLNRASHNNNNTMNNRDGGMVGTTSTITAAAAAIMNNNHTNEANLINTEPFSTIRFPELDNKAQIELPLPKNNRTRTLSAPISPHHAKRRKPRVSPSRKNIPQTEPRNRTRHKHTSSDPLASDSDSNTRVTRAKSGSLPKIILKNDVINSMEKREFQPLLLTIPEDSTASGSPTATTDEYNSPKPRHSPKRPRAHSRMDDLSVSNDNNDLLMVEDWMEKAHKSSPITLQNLHNQCCSESESNSSSSNAPQLPTTGQNFPVRRSFTTSHLHLNEIERKRYSSNMSNRSAPTRKFAKSKRHLSLRINADVMSDIPTASTVPLTPRSGVRVEAEEHCNTSDTEIADMDKVTLDIQGHDTDDEKNNKKNKNSGRSGNGSRPSLIRGPSRLVRQGSDRMLVHSMLSAERQTGIENQTGSQCPDTPSNSPSICLHQRELLARFGIALGRISEESTSLNLGQYSSQALCRLLNDEQLDAERLSAVVVQTVQNIRCINGTTLHQYIQRWGTNGAGMFVKDAIVWGVHRCKRDPVQPSSWHCGCSCDPNAESGMSRLCVADLACRMHDKISLSAYQRSQRHRDFSLVTSVIHTLHRLLAERILRNPNATAFQGKMSFYSQRNSSTPRSLPSPLAPYAIPASSSIPQQPTPIGENSSRTRSQHNPAQFRPEAVIHSPLPPGFNINNINQMNLTIPPYRESNDIDNGNDNSGTNTPSYSNNHDIHNNNNNNNNNNHNNNSTYSFPPSEPSPRPSLFPQPSVEDFQKFLVNQQQQQQPYQSANNINTDQSQSNSNRRRLSINVNDANNGSTRRFLNSELEPEPVPSSDCCLQALNQLCCGLPDEDGLQYTFSPGYLLEVHCGHNSNLSMKERDEAERWLEATGWLIAGRPVDNVADILEEDGFTEEDLHLGNEELDMNEVSIDMTTLV
eukprot:TRINITY_DN502_c0_g1_i1.p1 TRINITY_DN502_c0_g1~~TRINITY_DN502_c0_g1_i1.p1  ORF type:complete len:1509 (+),score=414.87 TRINITY_DN502_c0_g1_i1:88-4614(+)